MHRHSGRRGFVLPVSAQRASMHAGDPALPPPVASTSVRSLRTRPSVRLRPSPPPNGPQNTRDKLRSDQYAQRFVSFIPLLGGSFIIRIPGHAGGPVRAIPAEGSRWRWRLDTGMLPRVRREATQANGCASHGRRPD